MCVYVVVCVCVDWLAGAFGDSVRVGIHTIYVYVEIAKPITLVKRLIIRKGSYGNIFA